ncbi:MAG: DUF5018 domain-containing protein [Bacteroidota bacterium]
MKNFIKNIGGIYSILFLGLILVLSNCEMDPKFEDFVPDYTFSIIRSFEANGQDADIDHTNGVITTTLSAGSDLSAVRVDMTLPAGANVTPSSGSTVDFTNEPVIFTISNNGVSRDYTATIAAFGNPSIMTFSIGENMGVIDQNTGDIAITIGSQEDITRLAPQFTIPDGTTVTPGSGEAQDFRNPVKYTVVSNDGFTAKSYFVSVTQIAGAAISSFSIDGVAGTIIEGDDKILVLLPALTDVTALVPTIELPEGQTVTPESGVAQDFTSPVSYTVTNTEGLSRTYEVTVELGSSKVAFIGDGDDVNSIQDDDAKAAALFLQAQYPNDFEYIKFADVSTATLEEIDVVMLYYLSPLPNLGFQATPDNVMTMLPPELRPGTSQSDALTAWAKAGGNLFVAGDPTPIVHVIGRIPADYSQAPAPGNYQYTEFGCAEPGGCVDMGKPADDIWGLSVKPGTTSSDRQAHPIFAGLEFQGDGELYLSNSATREARLVWWQQFDNTMSGYTCCGNEGLVLSEQVFNAVRLGSLMWIGDAFGVGAIELLPTNGSVDNNFDFNIPTDFEGTVISIENTILGYEFDPNGTVNDYQGNIERLTTNIIDYLRTL